MTTLQDLDGATVLTAFVPEDPAFQATMPEYQIKYLLDPATGAADKFIDYALHTGALHTGDMTTGMNVTTLNAYHPLAVSQADANQVSDSQCQS